MGSEIWRKEYCRRPEVKARSRAAAALKALRDPLYVLLIGAKVRAKRAGLPFTITAHDFPEGIPDICPILGTPIVVYAGRNIACNGQDDSPSLDRIIPELGYIPGNVYIVSKRANTLKNNGNAEEHRRVADYIDTRSGHKG